MEFLHIIFKIVLLLMFIKALTIGSDYNFAARIRHGKKYTEDYFKNKEEFNLKWKT